MASNRWRESSIKEGNSNSSDSEDEVPGSLNVSLERNYQKSNNLHTSRTIICETESEDEDDDDEEGDNEETEKEDEYEEVLKKKTTHHNDESDVYFDHTLSSDNQETNDENSRDEDFKVTEDSSDSDEIGAITNKNVIRRRRTNRIVDEDSGSEDESFRTNHPRNVSDHISLDDSYVRIANDEQIKHSTIFEIDDSNHEDDSSEHLPLSISNSSAPEIAISLAKEEASLNGTDPLMIQQRALDSFKLDQLKRDLMKAKTLYNTANRDLLPDNGEKLRLNIASLEKQVGDLSLHLSHSDSMNVIQISSSNSSYSSKSASPKASYSFNSDYSAPPAVKTEAEMGKKALATFKREEALTVERITKLQQSLNRCPEEHEEAENPRGLKTKLMSHQKHALAWMMWREKEHPPGGLLADDMGLGKTLSMISLVVATKDESYSDLSESEDDDEMWSTNKKYGRPKGGTLVICPASLLEQWQNEVNNRCRRGVLLVELHHGAKRETVAKRLARNDIVVTTYQLVASEFKRNSVLFKIRWKRIILDEAHIIRNHTGKISEAACNLSGRARWALTGTPVHNKEQDLYALLKFLRVTPFNDLQVWKRWVDNKNTTGLKRLSTVTKTLMLRRTKQELISKGLLEQLPEKFFNHINVDLDEEEKKIYQAVLAFSKTLFAQFLTQKAEKQHMLELNAGKFDKPSYMQAIPDSQFAAAQRQLLGRKDGDVKAHHILVLLLRLRQICCHPGLIRGMVDKEEAEANGIIEGENEAVDDLAAQVNNMTLFQDEENENKNDEDVLFSLKNVIFNFDRPSSKIRAIVSKVEEILEKREKIIIVSEWTGMLEIVAQHLSEIDGATHEMFTGKVPIKKRQTIIDRFNDLNDDLSILLLSLTAGGVGLNLVGGNHLLLIDIHWNPQLEAQAQDRIYRFGQTKNVHIYKFLCNETVEQSVKELQEKKLNLAEDIFTGHRRTSNKLSLDDLKKMFEL